MDNMTEYERGLKDGAKEAVMIIEIYTTGEGMVIEDHDFSPREQEHREWRADSVSSQIVQKLTGKTITPTQLPNR